MDLVYVCRQGANEELRYSLRSMQKNFPESRVWVVGYKPEWYTGDFIPVNDIGSKFTNIFNAMTVVANTKAISANFIFMNDDFFLLKPISKMPKFHGGALTNKINNYRDLVGSPNTYISLLSKTYKKLNDSGIDNPIDYDIHVPMIFNKKKLASVISNAYLPRSIYGNTFHVGGKQINDVKKYNPRSRLSPRSPEDYDLLFISTDDYSFEELRKDVLESMFPEPSKYEVPLAGIEPATKRLEGSYSIH